MAKFRKKPVEIEAVSVRDVYESGSLPAWMTAALEERKLVKTPDGDVTVRTLEGTMVGHVNDWIIRGVKGELYPCKPDIFEATYDLVVDADVRPSFEAQMLSKLKSVEALLLETNTFDAAEAPKAERAGIGRALALARTKLDEARLWLGEALQRYQAD